MRIVLMMAVGLVLAACDKTPAAGGAAAPAAAPAAAGSALSRADLIVHGKYIVESVAMCGDCHTQRTQAGDPDAKKSLAGALLSIEPVQSFLPFKNLSPALAGLPQGCTEDTLALFLENGSACDNTPPLPPMPAFRMNEGDAKAVAAYLASLPKPTP